MLEQRYHDVVAYQQEIRDESANQRLARLGRARRSASDDRVSTLGHLVDRIRSSGFGHIHRPHPPSVHPIH